jgi:hypothetical protein
MKEYNQNYYKENKEEILDSVKKYYQENIEKVTEYKSKYWHENIKNLSKKNKDYYQANKEILISKNKEYKKKNKESINRRRNERSKERRLELSEKLRERRRIDPVYRLSQNIRIYLRNVFRNKCIKKSTKTELILGCSFIDFKEHIESQFEQWMSWDNYGLYNGDFNYGWDIDHIIPISFAKTEKEVIELSHFSNLRPLCSFTNRHIKSNKVEYDI